MMPQELSPAQERILRMKAEEGLTTSEIAERLRISYESVKHNLKWCRIRLNARTTEQAIYRAFQEGVFTVELQGGIQRAS